MKKKLIDKDLDIITARKLYSEDDPYWKKEILKYFTKEELLGVGVWVSIPDKKVGGHSLTGRLITENLVIGSANCPESLYESKFNVWLGELSSSTWRFLDVDTILQNKTNLLKVYDKYKRSRSKLCKFIWSYNKSNMRPVIYNMETGEVTEEPVGGFKSETIASLTYFSVIQKGQKIIHHISEKKKKKLEK